MSSLNMSSLLPLTSMDAVGIAAIPFSYPMIAERMNQFGNMTCTGTMIKMSIGQGVMYTGIVAAAISACATTCCGENKECRSLGKMWVGLGTVAAAIGVAILANPTNVDNVNQCLAQYWKN